jgi:hypothetical protein
MRAIACAALAMTCSGCVGALGELPIRLVGAVLAAGLGSVDFRTGYSEPVPQTQFSECEMARGRWREEHQEPDAVMPPEYRCGPNGEWPPEHVAAVVLPPPPPAAPPAPSVPEGFRVYHYDDAGSELTAAPR